MPKTRVLIVDDSMFFRKRLSEILSTDRDIEIIGEAVNGKEAVELAFQLSPDVITMDIEMPVMDGISAVREIVKTRNIPILMLSSFTTEGAKKTLDALDAGAVDYLSKNISDIKTNQNDITKKICERINSIANKAITDVTAGPSAKIKSSVITNSKACNEPGPIRCADYRLVVIGASTGGPPALHKIIENLPANYDLPVLIVQHMPESFTGPFADRLNNVSNVTVKLAEDGEVIKKGFVYISPGGHQVLVKSDINNTVTLSVARSSPDYTYKPCIDVTFESIAKKVAGKVVTVVLTGMGSDGTEGAKLLKNKNALIIVQDMHTSVIYGMPMMVAKAGIADYELPINTISTMISGSK